MSITSEPDPRDPVVRAREEARQHLLDSLGAYRVERVNMTKRLEVLRETTTGADPRDALEINAAIAQLETELRMANCFAEVRETSANRVTVDAEIARLEDELRGFDEAAE